MDQALDGSLDAGECAEGRELRDDAWHDFAHLVLVNDAVPVSRLGAADAQGDLLALVVHLHHVDVDLVAEVEELFRRLGAVPRDLGEVDEAVGAAEVDEDAEVAYGADAAFADLAFFQFA